VDESEGGAPALLAALGAIAAAGVWVGLRRRRSKLRTSS
jgi:LPXTG-motif cell wall-anchored protein